jgi:ParB family chromosome partitioning protein
MTDTTTFFDTVTTGNVKAAMKEADAKSSDLWMVPYDEIKVAEGFNVRSHDKGYEEHIDWLADQMVKHGYDRSKPMTGYVVEGNKVYITDGHSRHAAVAKAIARGAKIERIPVITHPPGTSPEDLVASLVTANSGRPLQPFEVATVCKRLMGYGLDEKTVAQRLGYTVPYVKDLLGLLAAPKAVREMVTKGEVSATLATKVIKEHGSKAAKVLKDAASAAKAAGKEKVTGKHVKRSVPVQPALSGFEALAEQFKDVKYKSYLGEINAHLAKHGFPTIDSSKPAGGVEKAVPPPGLEAVAQVLVAPGAQIVPIDLIRELVEYVEQVRVGDDAQDLLDRARAVLPTTTPASTSQPDDDGL